MAERTPTRRLTSWPAPPPRVVFRVWRVEPGHWRIDGGVDDECQERRPNKERAVARAQRLARAVSNGIVEVHNVNGSKNEFRRSVYVIELDQGVLADQGFLDANPQYVPGRRCFYVGSTGRTPEERFRQHREGYKPNRFANQFGLALCPEHEHLNPMTPKAANRREEKLAEVLRSEGHAVWQN